MKVFLLLLFFLVVAPVYAQIVPSNLKLKENPSFDYDLTTQNVLYSRFATRSCFYKRFCLFDMEQKNIAARQESDNLYISLDFSPTFVNMLFRERSLVFFQASFISAFVRIKIPYEGKIIYAPFFTEENKKENVTLESFSDNILTGKISGFIDKAEYSICVQMDAPRSEECTKTLEVNRPYSITFSLPINQ